MRRFVALFCAFVLSGAFAAGALAADLKLDIPLPLTGAQAKFGEIQKKSYEIAAEEVNAKGGIKGQKLVLSFEDSQGKPEIARTIVEKLIDEKKQPIIIGEYSSSCAKAVSAVAEERKTPYIVVASAADDITLGDKTWTFRVNQAQAYYASSLMDFMAKVVQPKTMVVLYESSDFGTSGSEEMTKACEKAGIKILMKEKYEKGAVDFKPILSQVKAANPDVIYMVSYVMDAALLMRQIKELRIDSKLFAGGAAGFAIPEFIDNAKDAAEYVVSATLWSPQVTYPGAKEYAEKYKSKYGDYPSYHGALAYSTIYVLKDALERAKSMSQEDIRAALKATDMMTAFGPVKFEDKDGYKNQNFVDPLVLQIIGGVHQTIWPEKAASAKYVYPLPKWRDRK
jgi:branched-chain amino acid transport system substrate-binding protein